MHYENFYCNLKRNETMGKKPDRNRALPQNLCLLDSMSVFHPISRRPTPPHTCLFHSPNLRTSYAKHASRRRRTTLHPDFRAHSIFNVQPPPPPQPPPLPPSPSWWLKNSPFLTYLASRAPRNPHADPRRVLAFPRFCISQTDVQFPLLAVFSWDCNVDQPRTRISFGRNWRQWNRESSSRSRWCYSLSSRRGVDSQCKRTGEALIQALRDDIRLLILLQGGGGTWKVYQHSLFFFQASPGPPSLPIFLNLVCFP